MVVIDEGSFVDALVHVRWVEIKDLIARASAATTTNGRYALQG